MVSGQVARADEVADVATKWGLIGTWRLNCGRPAGPQNPGVAFSVQDGKVIEERDSGETRLSGEVKSAAIRPDSALILVIAYPAIRQTREIIEIRYGRDTRRIQSDRNLETNEHAVENGRFTGSDEMTPAVQLCER